ncbi:hypothetical protein F4604DRAFT_1916886 [Suillus subluteus]|nr:hypothetical protein F4604DRAFT_1916886 [Suillus subluteus]
MGTQPDSGRAFPPDTVSSSTTNFGAQHLRRSPRLTAQHRQHPYIIPGRKPSTQKLHRVPENSSFGTDTGFSGPLTADHRRFTGTLEPSPLITPNVAPSTQLITSTLIPDLTSLITRCSPDPISGGTYGNIYKCIYHGPEGDEEVAIKAIRPQFFSAEMFRRELGIWKRLRHSNILKFMGTTSEFGPSLALVAPWMANGTLTSFLDQNNETLGLRDRLLLLRDIAAGLNYQDGHTDPNSVVHGDLTGTNVLIDSDRKAYLADFGLSRTMKKSIGKTYLANMSCHPGAVRWTAPELLSGEESASAATTQSDMYSFGSIMLQVLTGHIPWRDSAKDTAVLLKVIGGEIHPRPNVCYVTGQQWDFMTCCWSTTPIDRPPAEEAVQFVDSALHTSTSPQTQTLSISGDEQNPSTSPQSSILSIPSDERHPGMAHDEGAVCATAAPKPPTQARRTGAPKAKGAVRAKSGCHTCRIRRKKCDESTNADGSCQTCLRLRLQCLGFGVKRPEWLRSNDNIINLREKIKKFLAVQGMIKGHSGAGPRPNDQEPFILSLSADCASPSTSSPTLTLSISSDERHPGITRNDYLRGDTDARLPVMQDIDSPLDARENYPGVMLPAYPSTTYTTSLEPSWTQSNLPRPHTSDFSPTYHASFSVEDEYNVIPSGYLLPQSVNYNNTMHHNWVSLNMQQNASLQHYMQHVLRIQYLHADGSIAREAACLLANLHRKSTQGAIGYTAPSDHDVYTRIQWAPVTEGDALASLCMISYFLFSGGQGQWQAFLDSACEFSISVLQRNHISPDWALRLCDNSMRFIIKWFDVLASVTLIRRPKFLEVLRSLYGPTTAVNDGRPELSMMGVMGYENRIVLALAEIADLACWKDECRRAGRLSLYELVRRGQDIEAVLKATNDPDHLYGFDAEKSARRRLMDDPRCPEITDNITKTVKCLRRVEDVSTVRHVARSVVFSICICGCLTDVPAYRNYFLRRLQEQTETVGNCTRVAQLMREVWSRRGRGEPVDWRVVMQQSQMLLV